jgi:hypothetical protein
MKGNSNTNAKTIRDIAYEKNRDDPETYTIYIQEDDVFEPYFVVSDNYNGNCLLVRKFLVNENLVFSYEKSQGSYGGYYPDNEIDKYVNTVYFAKLSSTVQDKVLDTSIVVSTKDGVRSGSGIGKTENVKRKVFILSATELNIKSIMASAEGKPLAYFKNTENLVAYHNVDKAGDYWLRSSYHWDDIQAWMITYNGTCTGAAVSQKLSVRPAFCLQRDAVIQKENIGNKTVYVISP